jgi:2-polyprenyl-6-methoxyphenol hydroxylase-like FAD-dependent oxidoreductase
MADRRMTESAAGRSVEIVGGGIAGLTAALLFARAGWTVRVHERSPEIREIGAGIALKNNSISVLERLGVDEIVLGRGVRIRGRDILDARGRLVQHRDITDEYREIVVPRQDVVQGLAQGCIRDGVELVTGSRVVAAAPEGTLELASGERSATDLVVAADGMHSVVRDQAGLTKVVRDLASGATRYLIPRGEFEAGPLQREYWSGKRRIGISPCAPDLTYAYLSCPQADAGARLPLDVADWQRAFPGLADFLARFEAATGATRFAYPHVECHAWSRGRIAVIGDAAHALPPTLGQGAGLAIMNAAALVGALDEQRDIATALRTWEHRQRPLTDHTQRWSLRYDAMTTRWPPALDRGRRLVMWTFSRVDFLNAWLRAADRAPDTGAVGRAL